MNHKNSIPYHSFLQGKTTQTAQFILDDEILKNQGSLCRILCSQPRRISGQLILLDIFLCESF
jgi:hypothetical protein